MLHQVYQEKNIGEENWNVLQALLLTEATQRPQRCHGRLNVTRRKSKRWLGRTQNRTMADLFTVGHKEYIH